MLRLNQQTCEMPKYSRTFSETNVTSPSAERTIRNPSNARRASFSFSKANSFKAALESSSPPDSSACIVSSPPLMALSSLFRFFIVGTTCETEETDQKAFSTLKLGRAIYTSIRELANGSFSTEYLHNSSISRTLRYAMDSRMTDALSRWSTSSWRIGSRLARSWKISVSRERRQRAASRDFSLRFSLFL